MKCGFQIKSSPQCTSLPDKACWVEVGISTWPANDPKSCNQGYDSTCAFWADNRPNGGEYNEHPLFYFGADGVDLTPYLFYVTIVNNVGFSSNGSSWDINTNIYQGGNFLTGPDAQSVFPKGSSMNVNHITIGSELSDSGGSAATFYLQYNEWMDGGGNFRYQTNTGSNPSTNPPPNGYWAVNPCNCQGNTGGSFKTYD